MNSTQISNVNHMWDRTMELGNDYRALMAQVAEQKVYIETLTNGGASARCISIQTNKLNRLISIMNDFKAEYLAYRGDTRGYTAHLTR